MGILGWIVLGLLVGALAKLVMPGDDPGGVVVTGLLGIVGAILGGFIGKALFGTGLGDFFDLRTWVLALLGSLIVLGLYRVVARRRART
ncbi:GlsB/YeaQ/YmgE family stress response membrane protein [Actinomycetospora sp. TBRC 11914]|uniref:GlsB/YeaQ/YmgE family stress response membrane protein n=1 Tax=Actinomycetospora sp. TBRC 11914 TaxID=2729387 RepID=UPI00145F609C|nr:GlsB/YeaQ/YmgE family stress response membrane protein [Actinomycetospora sp. TBRC 11914]NMO88345.1 GlsB/YeaQ/YmgE family stress response membrane protein [Actinomycetospora sp. TBRC 11914]